MSTKQTNKQNFALVNLQNPRNSADGWYEPSLLAASVLYNFSMTMDPISIILATIALAGIITRRVTYVNIIN